jgi:hypothetical protein
MLTTTIKPSARMCENASKSIPAALQSQPRVYAAGLVIALISSFNLFWIACRERQKFEPREVGCYHNCQMQKEPSVHDNRIIAYSVHAAEQKIVIQTEYSHEKPHQFTHQKAHELTDIVFEEVLAYHFENDLFGAIVFDVREVDPGALLRENADMFEEGYRWGWPRGWEKDKEGIEEYVRRLNMRAFELDASYGMRGWVLAKQMTKIAKSISS